MQLLDRITALSQESVTSIRDIIWAIDPKSESVFDLLVRLKDYLLPLCRAAEIQLEFPDPVQTALPGKNLKPGERKDLWLLLKETGTNAIRHSGCGRLGVRVAFSGGTLTIAIRDDGSGFSPTSESDGKGAHDDEHARPATWGGSLRIESPAGKGDDGHARDEEVDPGLE
jgi:signal transduction histidine kinase